MSRLAKFGVVVTPVSIVCLVALLAVVIGGPPAVLAVAAWLVDDLTGIDTRRMLLFAGVAWLATIASVFAFMWISDVVGVRRSEQQAADYLDMLVYRNDGKTVIDLRRLEADAPGASIIGMQYRPAMLGLDPTNDVSSAKG